MRKGNIGFVFQSFNLIDELTVFENIELPLLYMKVSAAERRNRVEEAMERMRISHRRKHFPQQLSGGQPQRVAIARAVVSRPRSFLLTNQPETSIQPTEKK
jgi:putative ABC transport system ATP-binding protein